MESAFRAKSRRRAKKIALRSFVSWSMAAVALLFATMGLLALLNL
jgi:hypothetical protein